MVDFHTFLGLDNLDGDVTADLEIREDGGCDSRSVDPIGRGEKGRFLVLQDDHFHLV